MMQEPSAEADTAWEKKHQQPMVRQVTVTPAVLEASKKKLLVSENKFKNPPKNLSN